MLVSLEWLREITTIKNTDEEIIENIPLNGLEIESVNKTGIGKQNVVVGEILDKKEHPENKKLYVTEVDCGKFGKKQIIIVHDYEGTAKWVQEVNPWKSNKQGTQEYQEFIKKIRKKLKITFVWTRGHIGVEGNEIADKLAKEAIEKEYFKEYSEKVV
jgi:ribonuclease HI